MSKRFEIKGVYVVLLTLVVASLSTGCGGTIYLSNGYGSKITTSVNSWGNYNMKGKTFYIESGNEKVLTSDLEFKEYASYLAEDLKLQGATLTTDKINADMCILMNFGMADESYTETIPIPIWGITGFTAISTAGTSWGSAYSSAYVGTRYGITGYHNVDKRVTQYSRYINVYAFDNKNTSSDPIMLWKTNLLSIGASGDIRRITPFMMYIGWGEFGKDNGGWREYQVFEDDYMYKCWKQGILSNSNITRFPKYEQTNVPSIIKIVFVEKLKDETIVCLKKSECLNVYSISPNTYIYYNGKFVKISYADHYELGEKIRYECGTRYIRLHFPVNLQNVETFDFIEYTNAKETKYGLVWRGVKTK